MGEYFYFEKSNVRWSEELSKWMFLNRPFKRKGQALKACHKEYQQRKRNGLSLAIPIARVA
ncbi:hypothetical protein [Cronobacter dublinensis]|uniref:hypothetical protein n=1 Tax=Cronobacter dublinensis TaxID=413497 RepID=UPI000CFAC8DB|nr:hypothetical protein [Cronobacter dublinensis]ELQ6126725.1 hypothetical protein [Cronobacter dublinensis]ELQ6218487.1 hypothetical protein [Cronobacter dublinensis]ELY2818869.1 hypothetical protein [Cronobacter dublinensis]ELY4440272.1 hypothetical protein [Cronobacter dublinensis]MDT3605995.1 hypothetical protein [Cronobacter dublinensis]